MSPAGLIWLSLLAVFGWLFAIVELRRGAKDRAALAELRAERRAVGQALGSRHQMLYPGRLIEDARSSREETKP